MSGSYLEKLVCFFILVSQVNASGAVGLYSLSVENIYSKSGSVGTIPSFNLLAPFLVGSRTRESTFWLESNRCAL